MKLPGVSSAAIVALLLLSACALLMTPALAAVQVTASAAPERAFVRQQIILTVQAARPTNSPQGQLSEPRSEHARFSLLGAIEAFTQERDGVEYSILRKRYAVVPLTPGTLRLTDLAFRAAAVDAEQFTGGVRANLPGAGVAPVAAQDIELEILAAPATAKPWLPTASLVLRDHWSKPPATLRQGDAVTRTITISATDVSARDLPGIAMAEHDAYVIHADQPELHTDYDRDGMRAERVQRFVLLVVAPVELPSITVPWYDLDAGTMRRATIDKVSLAAATSAASSRPPAEPRTSDRTQSSHSPLLLAVLFALATGAVCAVVLRYWRGRHLRRAIRAVRRACKRNDASGTAAALLHYGQVRWPAAPPRSLLELRDRLTLSQPYDAQVVSRSGDALAHLDRHLFGPGTPWQGSACWQNLARALRFSDTNRQPKRPILPLTRLQPSRTITARA